MPQESQDQQYGEVKSKYFSYQTLNRLNKQQKQLRKKTSSQVRNLSSTVDSKEALYKKKYEEFSLKQKEKLRKFQENTKNQPDRLVDLLIDTLDEPSNSDVLTQIRKLFIKTIRTTKDRVKKILQDEVVSALGCSQEQQYVPSTIYIPVQSIDIFGNVLKYSPNERPGSFLYETAPFNPRLKPYSFNRELHNRIINQGISYSQQYGIKFQGITSQDLFDITYVTKDNNNVDGDFFKVDLEPRFTGYKVVDFLGEYYSSIDIVNIKEVYTNVLNALTGAITFQLKTSDGEARDQKRWEVLIQRILGMCYDNTQEIDVSGVGKLDQSDQTDDDLTQLNEIDNIIIEDGVKNLLSGVIEYADCGNIKLPISSNLITNLLNPFEDENLITSNPDFLAENLIDSLANNPQWSEADRNNLKVAINRQFLKVVIQALVNSILSPKHIFPLIVMTKTLQANQTSPEDVDGFVRYYKKFLMNLISKISTIFVQELLKEIKKSYRKIVQEIVSNQVQELILKKKKNIRSILLFVNIGLEIAATVKDFRRCQNIIDELKKLLSLSQRLAGINSTRFTNPLWNTLSQYKPGMTASGMMVRYIDELSKNGIDTGDLPDGSPNLGLIAQYNVYQSVIDEIAENSKTSVAITSADVYGLMSGGVPIINLWGNLE